MDILDFEVVWRDDSCGLLELKVYGKTKNVAVSQEFYVSKDLIEEMTTSIKDYVQSGCSIRKYIESGPKTGKYTPAFSMLFLPADLNGHITIEVDFEINDIKDRSHRCCFFIESEWGLIEIFAEKVKTLDCLDIGEKISLNEN